jgi:hypothetical protein
MKFTSVLLALVASFCVLEATNAMSIPWSCRKFTCTKRLQCKRNMWNKRRARPMRIIAATKKYPKKIVAIPAVNVKKMLKALTDKCDKRDRKCRREAFKVVKKQLRQMKNAKRRASKVPKKIVAIPAVNFKKMLKALTDKCDKKDWKCRRGAYFTVKKQLRQMKIAERRAGRKHN